MTISMDKKYQTRDGRPVRLLGVDGPGDFPVVGFVDDVVCEWRSDGRYWRRTWNCISDLIPVPEEVTFWVNVYRVDAGINQSPYSVGGAFKSEFDAMNAACGAVTTVPVTFKVPG